MTGPFDTPQWTALEAHANTVGSQHISELFDADPARMDWATAEACGYTLDFSKNRMTKETLSLLVDLADASDVAGWRSRMANGNTVNITEQRAALHMALRGNLDPAPKISGQDVAADVATMKSRMADFVKAIYSGARRSSSGKRFEHVVNIGIGGSDLGPRVACDALADHWSGQITPHFVANVDATELVRVLEAVDPETTLFIIASKSFTTQETLRNAETAKTWLEAQLPGGADVGCHFVAVTTNDGAAQEFGISADATFGFWDWVGGRYSVWSSVGLSVMLALGTAAFEEFLAGAAEMDQHFLNAPTEQNLPVLLALIGVWNHNFLGLSSHVILPYAQALSLFPSYLQQLDMESNGKSADKDGNPVSTATGPIIWGAAGTNGQHAFYQWLHQGTEIASADIILPLNPAHDQASNLADHHDILCSHAIAQAEAFAFGRNEEATRAELAAEGLSETEIARLLPHRTFAGNRPVSTILVDNLGPRRLGALFALYEHKVFVQGCIWNVNSFDQWGVELGKSLATSVLEAIRVDGPLDQFDPSTAQQIEKLRHVRNASRHEDESS